MGYNRNALIKALLSQSSDPEIRQLMVGELSIVFGATMQGEKVDVLPKKIQDHRDYKALVSLRNEVFNQRQTLIKRTHAQLKIQKSVSYEDLKKLIQTQKDAGSIDKNLLQNIEENVVDHEAKLQTYYQTMKEFFSREAVFIDYVTEFYEHNEGWFCFDQHQTTAIDALCEIYAWNLRIWALDESGKLHIQKEFNYGGDAQYKQLWFTGGGDKNDSERNHFKRLNTLSGSNLDRLRNELKTKKIEKSHKNDVIDLAFYAIENKCLILLKALLGPAGINGLKEQYIGARRRQLSKFILMGEADAKKKLVGLQSEMLKAFTARKDKVVDLNVLNNQLNELEEKVAEMTSEWMDNISHLLNPIYPYTYFMEGKRYILGKKHDCSVFKQAVIDCKKKNIWASLKITISDSEQMLQEVERLLEKEYQFELSVGGIIDSIEENESKAASKVSKEIGNRQSQFKEDVLIPLLDNKHILPERFSNMSKKGFCRNPLTRA